VVVPEALTRFVSPKTVHAVLRAAGRQSRRIRRIPAAVVVWLVIAIGIWADLDVPGIWRQVVGITRSLYLVLADKRPPCKSALSHARTRLGACALRVLFVATATVMRHARTDQSRIPYKAMILMIARGRLPDRDGRTNPRAVKNKMSKSARKRPEHCRPPQPEKPFRQSVVIRR